MERITAPVELYLLAPARSSTILVLILSPGVTTVILSTTPAATPASMLDILVGLPVAGSVGSLLRTVSKVRKRTPDFDALEMQNAAAPL